jgi:hypothetical protein
METQEARWSFRRCTRGVASRPFRRGGRLGHRQRLPGDRHCGARSLAPGDEAAQGHRRLAGTPPRFQRGAHRRVPTGGLVPGRRAGLAGGLAQAGQEAQRRARIATRAVEVSQDTLDPGRDVDRCAASREDGFLLLMCIRQRLVDGPQNRFQPSSRKPKYRLKPSIGRLTKLSFCAIVDAAFQDGNRTTLFCVSCNRIRRRLTSSSPRSKLGSTGLGFVRPVEKSWHDGHHTPGAHMAACDYGL